jgi:phosphatidylserine/phosphatidylglycerophosphate/cardiolipin synthase-like enzyme
MAKFLNTKKSVSEIEDLIRDAGQTLILISPYLKLSKDFKELLSYRNSKDKITTVIFGKVQLNPDEMKFLESLQFVILKYKDDLHAKCYLNDDKMIITSLNLYDFSMNNNKEMGVLIEKANAYDKELFEEAYKEVDYINTTSELFSYKTQITSQASVPKEEKTAKAETVAPPKTTFTGKFLSATALSKELGISSKDLTYKIEKLKWIEKKNEDWVLTSLGKSKGAEIKKGQYADYIVYPETIIKELM